MNSDINFEEIVFPTPWGHIAAKTWGDKKGVPVIAIHGFGENAGTFDHLIPLLPKGFYYVCLDLPSHGRSSMFPFGMTLDFFACLRELRRILYEHISYKKCILLSHSVGGHFSLFLASLYPEVVKKVVLLELMPFFLINDKSEICNSLRYNFETSLLLDKKTLTTHKYSSDNELKETFIRKHFTPISEKSAITLLTREKEYSDGFIKVLSDNRRDLLKFPVMTMDFHLSVIKNINMPVLVIITSESKDILMKQVPTSSESIKLLKKTLGPLFKVEFVEGNHSIQLEHPERVAPLISKFLKSDFCLL